MKKKTFWLYSDSSIKEMITVFSLLIITVCVLTWPLISNFSRAIPSGGVAPSVSLFQVFKAKWIGECIVSGLKYWNPQYYAPLKCVFTWTDPGVLNFGLICLISKIINIIPAYNLLLLLYMVLFGMCGYYFSRMLTKDRIACFFSGFWLAGNAFFAERMGDMGLVSSFLPVVSFIFFIQFFKCEKKRYLWLGGLFYFFTWLSCQRYALFFTLLFVPALLPFILSKKWEVKEILNIIFVFFVAILLLLPYLVKQFACMNNMGFEGLVNIGKGVFYIKELVTLPQNSWLLSKVFTYSDKVKGYSWDVGVVPLIVVMVSFFIGAFGYKAGSFKKKLFIFILLIIAMSLFLGFGPRIGMKIKGMYLSPYLFFLNKFPGFIRIQSPAQIAIFIVFALAVLFSASVAYLRGIIRSSRTRAIFTVILFLFCVVEMWQVPISLTFPGAFTLPHKGAIDWLKNSQQKGILFEFPHTKGYGAEDMLLESASLLRMLEHKRPLINGYSYIVPVSYKQLKNAVIYDFPEKGTRYLRALKVKYVLVDKEYIPQMKRDTIKRQLSAEIVYEDDRDLILVLPERQGVNVEAILPKEATYKQKPKEGQIIGILLNGVAPEAFFINQPDSWSVKIKWTDESGKTSEKIVGIHGKVLVDMREDRMFARLVSFPDRKAPGEAVLISQEEVKAILAQKSSLR